MSEPAATRNRPCATPWRRSARSSSPTAAASTARTSPTSPRHARRPRRRRHRRQPQLSRAPSRSWRIRHRAASSACATRSSRPASSSSPEYRANPANRCYFCKHELYTHLSRIAAERARGRRRRQQRRRSRRLSPGPPGGARVRRPQPARRSRSRRRTRSASCRAAPGLPTWDEPASACLSSRIPYHTEVTDEKLRTIERAEQALRALGFRVCRVRHHDELARVEIARDEMPRALEPEIARGDRARAEGRSATATSRSICRATASAA